MQDQKKADPEKKKAKKHNSDKISNPIDRWQFLSMLGGTTVFFFIPNIFNNNLSISKKGKKVTIQGFLGSEVKEVEIQIKSDRNKNISHYHEVSPLNPDKNKLNSEDNKWDIFYPVVDVVPTSSMVGIASFDSAAQINYSVNGMFFKEIYEAQNKALISSEHLLEWENSIYIQPARGKLNSFYLKDTISAIDGEINLDYYLCTSDWNGEVKVLLPQANGNKKVLASTVITDKIDNTRQGSLSKYKNEELSRERLIQSLNATINFTLGCQSKSSNSPTKNGLNLFYDLGAKTYRRKGWIWGWGSSIGLLVKASKLQEISDKFSQKVLIETATEIGETSLKFQMKEKRHPVEGIITSRFSEDKNSLQKNFGFQQFFSVADAQFLVGQGWIPLYEVTKNTRFLEGAKTLTRATGKLIEKLGMIPMDYILPDERWKDFMFSEQGFGTDGIAELYRVTQNPEYIKIGDDYMKMLQKKLERSDGLWNRAYQIKDQKVNPTKFKAKSHGWIADGLLAAYRLTKKQPYLNAAKKIATHLMENQHPDGHWNYSLVKSEEEVGISEKGTALWSLLFYKLYKETKDVEHLAAARKALLWCLNNQYDGKDYEAYGGLVGVGPTSGVIYRDWFPLACTYASSFFGLAVLEELSVQEERD